MKFRNVYTFTDQQEVDQPHVIISIEALLFSKYGVSELNSLSSRLVFMRYCYENHLPKEFCGTRLSSTDI